MASRLRGVDVMVLRWRGEGAMTLKLRVNAMASWCGCDGVDVIRLIRRPRCLIGPQK